MRPLLILATLLVTATSCTDPGGAATSSGTKAVDQGPFAGLGLRYDGYYRDSRGQVIYLIRFFPEGRAVLINGTKEVEQDLPKFLVRETKGNPSMGLYNVKVDVRGDSLHFMTRPEKGEISYRGKVMNASLVRLHRYSHINGSSHDMEYIFYPDSSASSPEQR